MEFDFNQSENGRKESSSQIKLELKTPLEALFMWLSIGSLFVLVIGAFNYMKEGGTPMSQVMSFLGLIFLGVFFNLYYNTDNFYVLDLDRKQLLYHFKFFFYKKISVAANFCDIHAVTVTSRYNRRKHDQWYTYQTVVVNNEGRVFQLSDPEREAIDKQRGLAEKIASLTGAVYVENPPESYADEVRHGSRYSFKHFRCSWLDSLKDTLIAMVGFMGFIALVASLNIYSQQLVEIFFRIFR